MATKALSHTGWLQQNGTFICYAWLQRPWSHTGWLQHNGTFICYAWPQRPSATQANYDITALIFVMHGHKGPQPHSLITELCHFYLICMATKALSHTAWLQHNCTIIGRAWICTIHHIIGIVGLSYWYDCKQDTIMLRFSPLNQLSTLRPHVSMMILRLRPLYESEKGFFPIRWC